MGYTHYWTNLTPAHNPDRWDAFITDVKKMFLLLNEVPFFTEIKLTGPNGDGDPIVTYEMIAFNGYEDCEPFIIEKDFSVETVKQMIPSGGFAFNFCKTRRRPYDTIVIAVLALYKHHFQEEVRVSSDGDPEDHLEGCTLLKRMFGYTTQFDH